MAHGGRNDVRSYGGWYLAPELLHGLVDGDVPGQNMLSHQKLQSEQKLELQLPT
jgi:hypothetical protein